MKLYCRVLAFMLLCVSCKEKKPKTELAALSSSDLFEKFRKQVVLIKNRSYFKATFDNGTAMYFTYIHDGGYSDITSDEEEAKNNAESCSGTGFFIGTEGQIATNFHVVSGLHQTPDKVNFQQRVIEALHVSRDGLVNDISWTAARLKYKHPEDSAYVQTIPQGFVNPADEKQVAAAEGGPQDAEEAEEETAADTTVTGFHERIDSLLEANKLVEALSTQSFQVEIVTMDLSVQLDASTKDAATYPCHILSLSQDRKVDLAIIQMDSGKTPAGVGAITDLIINNDEDHYGTTLKNNDVLKVTTPLYLIGFNYGEEIANTSDGIKVQLSKGEVTQESDQYRVLYSVPMLPGSSGSPVFNKKGQIVAINYCGYTSKDNFNYGILSSHLRYMIEHPPVTTLP